MKDSSVLFGLGAASLCGFLLCLPGCASVSPKAAGAGGDKDTLPVRATKKNETWRGEMRIRGSVVVPKGARLTILPGTVVRFERIDVDDDGIGDSELYVEGTLIAEGTVEHPILFTSAEKRIPPLATGNISSST
jgi:hypothetical protein